MLKKADLKEYVPIDQQLECWGGTDSYVFSFVPEPQIIETATNQVVNKKVCQFKVAITITHVFINSTLSIAKLFT